jgi:signal peptidase I
MHVQEPLLAEEDFIVLKNIVTSYNFPWHYRTEVIKGGIPGPGYFDHIVYGDNIPQSPFYDSIFNIFQKHLNFIVLARIRVNLNYRFSTSFFSDFHTDISEMKDSIAAQWTTSILYINTNNGYTELEDGTKIESVANRLVSFPANTRHRFVSQTDKQTRYMINFGYLKYTTP